MCAWRIRCRQLAPRRPVSESQGPGNAAEGTRLLYGLQSRAEGNVPHLVLRNPPGSESLMHSPCSSKEFSGDSAGMVFA